MCLIYSETGSKNILNKIIKNNGVITVYKRLEYEFNYGRCKITTPCQRVTVKLEDNKWLVSNRKHEKLTLIEKDSNRISKGIHVYLDKKYANYHPDLIVKAYGYKKYFVGADRYDESFGYGITKYVHKEAVFSRIHIDLKDLKKQLNVLYKNYRKDHLESTNDQLNNINEEIKYQRENMLNTKRHIDNSLRNKRLLLADKRLLSNTKFKLDI